MLDQNVIQIFQVLVEVIVCFGSLERGANFADALFGFGANAHEIEFVEDALAGERRIVVGEQSFQKALRLLHRFHVEGGSLTAPRVGLGCEGECISDQRASGEILAKITPGRIAILCNGVKLLARFDELARVECAAASW